MTCFWTDYLNTAEPDCQEAVLHLYFPPTPTAHIAYSDFACTTPAAIGTAIVTKVRAYTPIDSGCCCGCFYAAWEGNLDYSGICGAPTPGWHTTGTESPPITTLNETFDHLSHSVSTVNSTNFINDVYTYASGLFGAGANNQVFVVSITTDLGEGIVVKSNYGIGCE